MNIADILASLTDKELRGAYADGSLSLAEYTAIVEARKKRERVPDFCGKRLVETGAPCLLPEGHIGAHVPVTYRDAATYLVRVWTAWP